MKYNDYIPLATSAAAASGSRVQLPVRLRQPAHRRWAILGSGVVLVLVGLYFVFADSVDSVDLDDSDDLFVEDPEYQAAYLPFQPPPPQPPSALLTPTQQLPDGCRDAYFSTGALCYDPDIPTFDVVWTWVNGSDQLLQAAKEEAESRYAPDDPYRPKTSSAQARQYRDNDELRHSMRSVLANWRNHAGRFHLITSDFAVPDSLTNASVPDDWRLGQVPQWLDMENRAWRDENVDLNIIHHAQIFRPYVGNNFNSYAIESQFGNLPNVSEYLVYLNDDFYMSNPLTPRTFHTSAYGLVLRMDLGIMVSPEKPSPDEPHGEWRSMGESNVLLSDRFGARHRPYVLHEAKAVSMSIIRELSAMWAPHLARAATHPFRETVSGAGDVSMLFLMAHFLVERWREALLWAWAVARHGGLDDGWGADAAALAWAELGGAPGARELTVRAGLRETLEPDRVHAYLRESGHRQADKTFYVSSALDGYPYMYLSEAEHGDWQWFKPSSHAEDDMPACTLFYDECFTDGGAPFERASELFKHIAFRNTQCGDCAIQALMKASGRLGMEAFLPPPLRVVPRAEDASTAPDAQIPHLPLAPRWEDAQFSLQAVLGPSPRDINVREWTLRLLERYRFVIGYTPYAFVMLENYENARGALGWIDSYGDAALLCINDDVQDGEDRVSGLFRDWQERRWHRPAAWERAA
ncbi:hypothetical protein PsYK624_139070 [Phanerochaete sordida]|uniref:Stealth protein CR3 conserved region 3 domain-containing protein n=1 Tax=Phanerochaete sordida TaxID=48140 RepID=A0A9P3GME6_9APHY|nr:hypothetical protein PsYK624_139070 [Phanerochaete sordida]